MKKTKGILRAMGLALGLLILFGASAGYAAGIPFAAAVFDDGTLGTGDAIIVGKFDSTFTFAEANSIATSIADAVGLFGLGNAGVVLTPADLQGLGLTDADQVKATVKQNYVSMGFSFYATLDIKKVAGTSAALGKNIRIDVRVADLGFLLGLPEDNGYLYITSIEIPETFVSLLGSFAF